jgi:fructokinase
MSAQITALLEQVLKSSRRQARRVVAIAGPPASGKSTLAAGLVAALRGAGVHSQLVPMDGFHLDNRILTDRGILDRKGSPPSFDAIVIEGNYLLMDAPIWRDMARYWDLSIHLSCAEAELEARLIQRWVDYGLAPEAARIRTYSNDLPNARLVGQTALRADVVL